VATKPYTIDGVYFPSQSALEREVKARLKDKPRNRIFRDSLFQAIVNELHPDVVRVGERSTGEFEVVTYAEQARRRMQTASQYRGGVIVMTHFARCDRWLDVTLYPWRQGTHQGDIACALRNKVNSILPRPGPGDHCTIMGCDADWRTLEYHHLEPTFKAIVESAMAYVSEKEIETRFDYDKFRPGTFSIADFIPDTHPAVLFLIEQHQHNTWQWLCAAHHRGPESCPF